MLLQYIAQAAPRLPMKGSRLGLNPYAVLIIQIIIIVVALIVFWWVLHGRNKDKYSKDDSPMDILKKRYAAGEVSKEDYERIKKDIT